MTKILTARVACRVCTRERNELSRGGFTTATTCDVDLSAFRVELLPINQHVLMKIRNKTCSWHGVEGDRLKADEVAATRDRGRDGGSPAVVGRNHLSCSPNTFSNGTRKQTSFLNLELEKG